MGIHYDELKAQHSKLKKGETLELRVTGMLPLGRFKEGHPQEGEPIPPALANGTIVQVIEVGVDQVRVKAIRGEFKGKEVVFAHAKGASKLEAIADEEAPEPPKGTGDAGDKGEGEHKE